MAKKTTPASPKKSTSSKSGAAVAEMANPAVMADTIQTVQVAIPSSPGKSADQTSGSRREITHEMIAERAYDLYMKGTPGSPEDHWAQAEAELRGS